jgi:hypothetical protein
LRLHEAQSILTSFFRPAVLNTPGRQGAVAAVPQPAPASVPGDRSAGRSAGKWKTPQGKGGGANEGQDAAADGPCTSNDAGTRVRRVLLEMRIRLQN